MAALDPRAPAGTLCLRTLVVRAFGRGGGGGRKVCLIRAILSHENSSRLSPILQDLEVISRGLASLGVRLVWFFNVANYKALNVRTCGGFIHFLTVLFYDLELTAKPIFWDLSFLESMCQWVYFNLCVPNDVEVHCQNCWHGKKSSTFQIWANKNKSNLGIAFNWLLGV